MVTTQPRHRFEEHTGEVRMALWAPSHEGLFIQAARALAELMVEKPEEVPLQDTREVTVEGRDAEALLVNWLDELIFLTDTTGWVAVKVESMRLEELEGGGRRIVARIQGGPPPSFKTSVKAATFHGLKVDFGEGEGEVSASVILDV